MGATCAQAVSCLTCTPITGCGWCQLPDGTGRCVVDPNDCEGEKVFTWTWDPEGCRVALDANSVSTGTPPSHDSGAARDSVADASDAD
jgi:hypothetical protein